MMKPDLDIDTEKYSDHNVAKINFIAGREALRRTTGVMGHCVLKKNFILYFSTHQPYISTT